MRILRSGWREGAAAGVGGPVLVSVTDFTAARITALPGIARAGFGLRRAWPELDGAVGVWLWTLPRQRRTGSVAVWRNEKAMHGFVRLPEHVAIMRHYRDRGTTRATTWAEHWTGTDASGRPDGLRDGRGDDLDRIWRAAAAYLGTAHLDETDAGGTGDGQA